MGNTSFNGKSWIETLELMQWNLPHMAALRNIRGFAASNPGVGKMLCYLEMLVSGVKGGKQFPFRYITAYNEIKNVLKNQLKPKIKVHYENDENIPLEEQQPRKKGNIIESQLLYWIFIMNLY